VVLDVARTRGHSIGSHLWTCCMIVSRVFCQNRKKSVCDTGSTVPG
jgi:hypothetical protein